MTAHTKEPWDVHHATHCRGEYWASIGANGSGPITDIVGAEGNPAKYYIPVAGMMYLVTPVEEQKANAKRIVDCVNACQGLNPEAIPEAVEALDTIAYKPIGDAEATNEKIYRDIVEIARNALAALKADK